MMRVHHTAIPPTITTTRRSCTMDRHPARGFEKGCELVAHLLPIHGAAPDGTCALWTRIHTHALHGMARQPGHRYSGRAVRVLVVPAERLSGHETEFRPEFLEAPDSAPQALTDVGFCAEPFDQVEGHVKLVADLAIELCGGVGDGEEENGEGGDEEVVEGDLLHSVNVARFV